MNFISKPNEVNVWNFLFVCDFLQFIRFNSLCLHIYSYEPQPLERYSAIVRSNVIRLIISKLFDTLSKRYRRESDICWLIQFLNCSLLPFWSIYCSIFLAIRIQHTMCFRHILTIWCRCSTNNQMCKRYYGKPRQPNCALFLHYLHGILCIPRQRASQNLYARWVLFLNILLFRKCMCMHVECLSETVAFELLLVHM